LVTGGTGFIGSHLIEQLLQHGASVTVVDNLSTGKREHIDTSKINLIEQDVNDLSEDRLSGVDVLLHLAASVSVPKSNQDPMSDFRANSQLTLKLLELVRKSKADLTFFYPSTTLIYGESGLDKIPETTGANPLSFYGLSKYTGERYTQLYADLYGLKTRITRYFNVYGPRQQSQVVFDTIKKIAENPEKISMFGTGKEARDFIYVKDLVAATLAIVASPSEGITNVGTGNAITIQEILATLLRICNIKDCEVTFSQRSRLGDVTKNRADVSRLSALGFHPSYTLDQGLTETIRWFEKEFNKKLIR